MASLCSVGAGPSSSVQPVPVIYPPEAILATEMLSHPQTKRRRAKRTEEERIEYLRADNYVAQFEAYRVLCASCDKWIRLRPNSTYCSIPWDAHRKSCLAKKMYIVLSRFNFLLRLTHIIVTVKMFMPLKNAAHCFQRTPTCASSMQSACCATCVTHGSVSHQRTICKLCTNGLSIVDPARRRPLPLPSICMLHLLYLHSASTNTETVPLHQYQNSLLAALRCRR